MSTTTTTTLPEPVTLDWWHDRMGLDDAFTGRWTADTDKGLALRVEILADFGVFRYGRGGVGVICTRDEAIQRLFLAAIVGADIRLLDR